MNLFFYNITSCLFFQRALIFFVVVIIVQNEAMTTANVYYDIIISQLVSFQGVIFSHFYAPKKSNDNARPRTQMLHEGLSQFIKLITFLKLELTRKKNLENFIISHA